MLPISSRSEFWRFDFDCESAACVHLQGKVCIYKATEQRIVHTQGSIQAGLGAVTGAFIRLALALLRSRSPAVGHRRQVSGCPGSSPAHRFGPLTRREKKPSSKRDSFFEIE